MRWRSLPAVLAFAVLAFAVLASPLVREAQHLGKTYRIGVPSRGNTNALRRRSPRPWPPSP